MAKIKPSKPYWEMNTAELREATAEFDAEFVSDSFRPPTAKEREQLARARKKAGTPSAAKGSERVLVTIERGLLRDADAFAKAQKTSRSQLIAQGLRTVLNKKTRRVG